MTSLTIIVAATLTNGIGKGGTLPWRLPKEMAYFTKVTSTAPEGSTNAVLMGRNTWESIPAKFRPLRRRTNIVISRNSEYPVESTDDAQAFLCTSLGDALDHLKEARLTAPLNRAFIIGGAGLYKDTLALPASAQASVDRILLTRVLEPAFEDCDVFMPAFEKEGHWHRASHAELIQWVGHDVPEGELTENGVKYEFQMWLKSSSM